MTKGTWLSPVSILNSRLLSASYNVHHDYDSNDPVLSLSIDYDITHPDLGDDFLSSDCILFLTCSWHDPEDASRESHSASCRMGITAVVPKSSFSDEIGNEERIKYVDANAVSLTYGKIRALLEALSAQSTVGQQTIPAIDPYALLETDPNEGD